MYNNITITHYLHRILNYIILFFPLSLILGNAAINISTTLVSLIVIYFFFFKEKIFYFKDKILIYVFFLFLYVFVNSIINSGNLENILKSLSNLRYLFLSVGVLLVLKKFSFKEKKIFVYSNLFLILFVCLDIIFQYLFYRDVFGFFPGMCPKGVSAICYRFSGPFGDELVAGSYLSQIGLLFLLQFKFLFQNLKIDTLNYKDLSFIFLFVVILISGERTAILIFSFCLIIYFLLRGKIINIILIFLSLFLTIFILSQVSESVKYRFLKINIVNDNRLDHLNIFDQIKKSPWGNHYIAAYELFNEKPLIGHGPKTFRYLCKKTKIEQQLIKENRFYSSCSTHPHNYLFEFLSEYGIIGAALFIIFIFIIFFKVLKIGNKSFSEEKFLSLAIGALLLSVMIPLKPSGSFFSTFNASMLFYLFGHFLYYLRKIR